MFKIDTNQYQFILILEPNDYCGALRHHTHVQHHIARHLMYEAYGVFGISSYQPFEFEIIKNRYSAEKKLTKDYSMFLLELATLYSFIKYDTLQSNDNIAQELAHKLYSVWKSKPHLIEPLKQYYDIDFIKYINREIDQIDYYFPHEKK